MKYVGLFDETKAILSLADEHVQQQCFLKVLLF